MSSPSTSIEEAHEISTHAAPEVVSSSSETGRDVEHYGQKHINEEINELEYDRAISPQDKRDANDMLRMGKTQQLKRNFRAFSTLSFTIVLQATWEFTLISLTQGLNDGGRAGLVWSYVWTLFGFVPVIASLAEMASMAPTSGGQYHWVSEFAPPRYQKILSYLAGWQATLAWQAGTASGSFLAGTIVQGLISVSNPDYEPTGWQGTLLVFAFVLMLYVVNVYLADGLPSVQNVLLVFHVFMFVAVIVCLWVLVPHANAHEVFLEFYNGSEGYSMGLALMVGQISAIFGSLGSDAAAHMSEEVKDAGSSVPRAMFWSYIVNFLLGLIFLISFCFAIPDVYDALNDPTEYPFLYVFRFMGPAGVYCLTAGVLLLLVASNISYNASTARQTWAFARDGGLVFNKWLSKVDEKRKIPVNAVIFSCLFSAVLSLINIGSSTAFNAIISLNTVALMLTYCSSIGCVLYRRIAHPTMLPKARWSLGKWGILINAAGLAYASFAFFWCFWPNLYMPDAKDFNWSVVIFVAVFILSGVVYLISGRHTFVPPVLLVKGRGNSMYSRNGDASMFDSDGNKIQLEQFR